MAMWEFCLQDGGVSESFTHKMAVWEIFLQDGRISDCWGLSAGYQPRPQVVDRGTTARYGGQLRYI